LDRSVIEPTRRDQRERKEESVRLCKQLGHHRDKTILPALLASVQSPKRFSNKRRLRGGEVVSWVKEVQALLKDLGE